MQQIIGVDVTCMSGTDGLRGALLGGAASFCSGDEFPPAETRMKNLGKHKNDQ